MKQTPEIEAVLRVANYMRHGKSVNIDDVRAARDALTKLLTAMRSEAYHATVGMHAAVNRGDLVEADRYKARAEELRSTVDFRAGRHGRL